VYMLNGMGLKSGVNLEKLLGYTKEIESVVGRKMRSKTSEAGLPTLNKI
jgi:hypothetical protein